MRQKRKGRLELKNFLIYWYKNK